MSWFNSKTFFKILHSASPPRGLNRISPTFQLLMLGVLDQVGRNQNVHQSQTQRHLNRMASPGTYCCMSRQVQQVVYKKQCSHCHVDYALLIRKKIIIILPSCFLLYHPLAFSMLNGGREIIPSNTFAVLPIHELKQHKNMN